jgi:hypothetical protein
VSPEDGSRQQQHAAVAAVAAVAVTATAAVQMLVHALLSRSVAALGMLLQFGIFLWQRPHQIMLVQLLMCAHITLLFIDRRQGILVGSCMISMFVP